MNLQAKTTTAAGGDVVIFPDGTTALSFDPDITKLGEVYTPYEHSDPTETVDLYDTLPGVSSESGSGSGGSGGGGNNLPTAEAAKWAKQPCDGLAGKISNEQGALDAFRKVNGGSYVENSALATQRADAEFKSYYGESAAETLGKYNGVAGFGMLVGDVGAHFVKGEVKAAMDVAGAVYSGVSSMINTGTGAHDLGSHNTYSSAENFVGAASDMTGLIFKGAEVAEPAGWALAGGGSLIFGYERYNIYTNGIGDRNNIAQKYSDLISMESNAINKIDTDKQTYSKNCD